MEEAWEQQVKFFAKVIQIMGVAPQYHELTTSYTWVYV